MDIGVLSSAGWGALLVLAVPFAIIVMNELLERRGGQRPDLASVLRLARDLVLPSFVLVLVLRIVFDIDTQNALANLASTVFWLMLIVLVYRISVLVIGAGEYEHDDWRARAPQLFLRMIPYTIIALIIYHVSQNLWALPVREMATTLGIGSVVIAFALQATLSNLVSGLLMIANSPFKTGDWVRVDDIEGQIVGVNWRYTEIVDEMGNFVVIPNGAIADGSIHNLSRPTTETLISHRLQFSLETPPNEVKRLLADTMIKTPNILTDPAPAVLLSSIENPIVSYTVEFWIDDFGARDAIRSDLLTRVWYAARRENIPIPVPLQGFITARKSLPGAESDPSQTDACRRILEELPGFASLSESGMEEILAEAAILQFAEAERILDVGDAEPGLLIVSSGQVRLEISDPAGGTTLLDMVGPGGILGEAGLFGRAVSPINAIAQSDCALIVVPHARFSEVLNRERALNEEVNALINQRSQLARRLNAPSAREAVSTKEMGGDAV